MGASDLPAPASLGGPSTSWSWRLRAHLPHGRLDALPVTGSTNYAHDPEMRSRLPKRSSKGMNDVKHFPGRDRAAHQSGSVTNRPSKMVTAWPDRYTRPAWVSVRTIPVRADAWKPTSWLRPSRSDQKGASTVWALPVTGSSGMPSAGEKKRDTKSYSRPRSAMAVTVSPRI